MYSDYKEASELLDSPSKIKIPYFLAIFRISNLRSSVEEHPDGLHPVGLQLHGVSAVGSYTEL